MQDLEEVKGGHNNMQLLWVVRKAPWSDTQWLACQLPLKESLDISSVVCEDFTCNVQLQAKSKASEQT
eukprot:1335653-Amphidinium_carterae.1